MGYMVVAIIGVDMLVGGAIVVALEVERGEAMGMEAMGRGDYGGHAVVVPTVTRRPGVVKPTAKHLDVPPSR